MKIVKLADLEEDAFDVPDDENVEAVREILEAVRQEGDEAVKRYTKVFDGIGKDDIQVSKFNIEVAYEVVEEEDIYAMKEAAAAIKSFSRWQMDKILSDEMELNGITVGQKIVPISKVGCYVPGGRYPLPSSALMSIIPAKIAGVDEVVVCSPKISPTTIVAADIAGADKIFRIGGVQAIAAMAFGTEMIPAVDKIVGPGNAYVTTAKREVYGQVGIDMLAGPSELLVIADGSADATFITADLLAQAEHDPMARVWLLTTSQELAQAVLKEVGTQLHSLPTADVAVASMDMALAIIVDDIDKAVELSNKVGPEHLEVQIEDPDSITDKLTNYGSLFIGKYSAEVLGDYCSGPNHILPTGASSRFRGGLSVMDFVKILTYQKANSEGGRGVAKIAAKLARIEGLEGHARAAEKRLE